MTNQNKIGKELIKKSVQDSLEELCNKTLYINTHQKYSDRDLFNATHIFSHVVLDVLFTENKDNLSKEDMEEVATLTGKMIRELILTCSGKDMHIIAKNL